VKDRRHLFWWPVLSIGVALIVFPFAVSMPSKTEAAQKMLDNFRPMMQGASLVGTADHYYDTFVQLGLVAQAKQAIGNEATKRLPQLLPVAAQVVGALYRYKPSLDEMQSSVMNFRELESLPSLRLFTWIFVIPGTLLVLLAAASLAMGLFRPRAGWTA
jgi:hypothetical protein